MRKQTSEEFLIASLKIGQAYLAFGGSISHFENCILSAGKIRGLVVSVHATPVSLTLSTFNTKTGYSKSLSARISQSSPHLSKLVFAERLLTVFARGTLRSKKLIFLVNKISTIQSYPMAVEILALFLIGFCASYKLSFQLSCGFLGGFVTLVSCLTCKVFSRVILIHENINDFFLSFVAVSLSIPLASFLHLHPSQLFIGTIALVLPGLTLTSAISDLIEDHFQTGLVKFAKASLALLSMGCAYILAAEWTRKFGFMSPSVIISKVDSVPIYILSLATTIGMILSFCILLKVPRRSVFGCLFIGSAGWTIFNFIATPEHPFAASLISALCISVFARGFAKMQRMVIQVYIVPSILVLVPGLLAFSYLQPLVDNASLLKASQSVLSSLMIAVALSIGVLLGQIRLISSKKKNLQPQF